MTYRQHWKLIERILKTVLVTPWFAHVFRDADDAIYERDGYNYDGYTLRVERPRGLGGSRGGGGGRGGGGSFRSSYGGRGDHGSRGRGGGPGQATRRSDHRVSVTGLFCCNCVYFPRLHVKHTLLH